VSDVWPAHADWTSIKGEAKTNWHPCLGQKGLLYA
jgi:hypothetical protein